MVINDNNSLERHLSCIHPHSPTQRTNTPTQTNRTTESGFTVVSPIETGW